MLHFSSDLQELQPLSPSLFQFARLRESLVLLNRPSVRWCCAFNDAQRIVQEHVWKFPLLLHHLFVVFGLLLVVVWSQVGDEKCGGGGVCEEENDRRR